MEGKGMKGGRDGRRKAAKKTALYCTNQWQFNSKNPTPNNAVFAYQGNTHTRAPNGEEQKLNYVLTVARLAAAEKTNEQEADVWQEEKSERMVEVTMSSKVFNRTSKGVKTGGDSVTA